MSTHPVPYWHSDRDYYGRKDPLRAAHLAQIEMQERINRRIVASSSEGDGSYCVVVNKGDCR
jgi:hypothetical protein